MFLRFFSSSSNDKVRLASREGPVSYTNPLLILSCEVPLLQNDFLQSSLLKIRRIVSQRFHFRESSDEN